MADNINQNDGNGGLYFIVGGLVVVVAVLGFVFFGGEIGGPGPQTTEVKIEAPKIPAPAAPAAPAAPSKP